MFLPKMLSNMLDALFPDPQPATSETRKKSDRMIADFREAPLPPTPEQRRIKRFEAILATAPASANLNGEWLVYVWLAVSTLTRGQLARVVWPWEKADLTISSERPTVRGRRAVTAGA